MSQKNSRLVTPIFTRYFEKKFDEGTIDDQSSSECSEDDEEEGPGVEVDTAAAIRVFNRIVAQQSKVVSDSFSFHHNSKKEKNVRTVYMTHLSDLSYKNAQALVAEEEKERQKAEKKKVKKKKRKERKKEMKENGNVSSNKTSRSGSLCNGDSSSAPVKRDVAHSNASQNPGSRVCVDADENDNINGSNENSEDEAFLDPNSAFVSKAVSKNKRKASSSISTMEQTCIVASRKGVGSQDSALTESEKLVREGCALASREQYADAVAYFSKAIRLVSHDHRFYSNRSFCYCQLDQYNKALKDAEKCIELAPQNPKGYYRKAEALRGLNQYKQAEMAYLKVLQLDEQCEEARQDIEDVKVLQLVEMGFDEDSSRLAVQRYHTVQAAIEELTLPHSSVNAAVEYGIGDVYFSDDDDFDGTGPRMPAPKPAPGVKDIKMDPSNPEGLYSLWVGNITQSVTEKQILELFARYGAVQNVRLLSDKFCAFVNFRNQKAPGQAMKSLQGAEFGGAKLLIRFPDTTTASAGRLPVVSQGKSGAQASGEECYFWRTSGCSYGDKCRYRHPKESKGVDLKSWHKNR